MPYEEIDPLVRMRKLEEKVELLERQMKLHVGYQQGAATPNNPHPQYSAASRGAYTVTNGTTDRSYNADTVVVAELADVVYTLITDLQSTGQLG